MYDPKPKVGYTPKLDAQIWSGPWMVVRRISSCVYLVEHQTTKRRTVINVDAMAPYTVLDEERFPSAEDTSDEDEGASSSDVGGSLSDGHETNSKGRRSLSDERDH